MDQKLPQERLNFRKRKITIVVAICPKFGRDMFKKKTMSPTQKIYVCTECGYRCESIH